MAVRIFAVFTIVAAIGNGAIAQQNNNNAPRVGDHVVVQMTDDLAKVYARRTGFPGDKELPKGLEIQTIATIEQQFDDGRIRIEHSSPVNIDGKLTRLVTFTATVDATKITTDTLPKGSQIYASPAAKKSGVEPILTREETKTRRLHLSDLKGVKLRSWTLSEEIGD